MPGGLLSICSEPGSAVTTDEFNDWYDNENVPARLPIPGVQTCSRWVAIDGKTPTYAAIYDVASPFIAYSLEYTNLETTRPEREEDIIARAPLSGQRTYKLLESAYDPTESSPFLFVVEIDTNTWFGGDLNRWYKEEHMALIAKVPSWVRTRRGVLVDTMATSSEPGGEKPSKLVAFHEL